MEDSIGFQSYLGKISAPRAQSSQAPLLESADDWKVQFDVNNEGLSVKERAFPSEVAPGSQPGGGIVSIKYRSHSLTMHGDKAEAMGSKAAPLMNILIDF